MKTRKTKMVRCLSVLLVALLTVGAAFAALPVAADEPATRYAGASVWNGTVLTVASESGLYTFSGEGTEASPWLLQSAEDVAKLAANVNYASAATNYNGKYFKLTCDLNLNKKEWVGIGYGDGAANDNKRFEGVFDGDGHVIYDFNMVDKGYNGFFGYAGNGAVIKNIGIASGEIYIGSTRSGPLIGFAKFNLTVSNCFSRAKIHYSGNGWIGGLIGTVMNDGTAVRLIEDCYFAGEITMTNASKNYAVGGVVGVLNDGTSTVSNCYNIGKIDVTASTSGDAYTDLYQHSIGGIIGTSAWPSTLTINDCGSGGSISYTNKNETYPLNKGTLAGYVYISSNLTVGAGNTASVAGVEKHIGGGYETQPTNVSAVANVAVPYAAGSQYFIGAVATDVNDTRPGGEPDEQGGGETPEIVVPTEFEAPALYEPADKNEKVRYEAASKWDGEVLTVASLDEVYTFEGSGTESDPYLLQSAEDVAKLSANVRFADESTNYLEKHFKLTCDLDLQNYGWYGIGGSTPTITWNDNAMFSGYFDGDNHVIYNFNLADRSADNRQLLYCGFFGYAGYCEIRNLGIVNGDVHLGAASRSAALIGASRYDLTVVNCFNRANLTFVFNGSGEPRVGGLMGAVMNNQYTARLIEDCYNSGNVTLYAVDVQENIAGGIAGYLSDGTDNTFVRCVNTGKIHVVTNQGRKSASDFYRVGVGSLVGSLAWKADYTFEDCQAGGEIVYYNNQSDYSVQIGAFAGYINASSKVAFQGNNQSAVTADPAVGAVGYYSGSFLSGKTEAAASVSVSLAEGEIYFMKNATQSGGSGTTDPDPVTTQQPEETTPQPAGSETAAPATTAPAATTEPTDSASAGTKGNGGCKSTVGMGLGVLLALAGTIGACLIPRKQNGAQ